MTSLAFSMLPQYFAACFTARSGKTIRHNAVIMLLYSITMSLVLFVGFSAVLVLPGLRDGDLALLTIVRKSFPAWFLGIIGGAGALTAMLPAAIQLLTGATLYAKNLFRPILAPGMTVAHQRIRRTGPGNVSIGSGRFEVAGKARQHFYRAESNRISLLQSGILLSSLFQNSDIRVGSFPRLKKILIRGLGFGLVSHLHISPSQL